MTEQDIKEPKITSPAESEQQSPPLFQQLFKDSVSLFHDQDYDELSQTYVKKVPYEMNDDSYIMKPHTSELEGLGMNKKGKLVIGPAPPPEGILQVSFGITHADIMNLSGEGPLIMSDYALTIALLTKDASGLLILRNDGAYDAGEDQPMRYEQERAKELQKIIQRLQKYDTPKYALNTEKALDEERKNTPSKMVVLWRRGMRDAKRKIIQFHPREKK